MDLLSDLLAKLRSFLERVGAMTRFFGQLLWLSPGALLRFLSTATIH